MVREDILDESMGYIDRSTEEFIDDLRKLCRQPSISAEGIGIRECVDLIKRMMETVGISVRIVPMEGGHPIIFGEIMSGESNRTLIFYNHYDVQPPGPKEEWLFEPFSAETRGGKVYSRGVSDNKGNLVARLKATQALVNTLGSPPANLKFVFEGEEEIGSPHLPDFVRDNRKLLKADGCLWEGSRKDVNERPIISLGHKGILLIQIRTKGPERKLHSRWAPIISNPTWRLISALTTMRDEKGRIMIEGFHDDIVEPSLQEIEMLKPMVEDEEGLKEVCGVKDFRGGLTGIELLRSLIFEPTCTVTAINPGFPKGTTLPTEATAQVHFRLVMGQKPEDILKKVEMHFDQLGYDDIKISKLGAMEPNKTSIRERICSLAIEKARQTYGVEPVVYPNSPGASPMYYFNNWLGIPSISACGVGYAGSNVHAPNENIRIRDYIEGIRYLTSFILCFR
jgi:acetylornithine deacetylase/succinyl-diaminopimelate desuccinylase-like protein